ncbi:hypothetical protein P4O66_010146, partial [Electrophorus voltai]
MASPLSRPVMSSSPGVHSYRACVPSGKSSKKAVASPVPEPKAVALPGVSHSTYARKPKETTSLVSTAGVPSWTRTSPQPAPGAPAGFPSRPVTSCPFQCTHYWMKHQCPAANRCFANFHPLAAYLLLVPDTYPARLPL